MIRVTHLPNQRIQVALERRKEIVIVKATNTNEPNTRNNTNTSAQYISIKIIN